MGRFDWSIMTLADPYVLGGVLNCSESAWGGWRPLDREQQPLDLARAALDDAIPVLTCDPLTTAERFVGREQLDYLSDAELLRKASRELAIAVIVVADAVTRPADTARTRSIEVGTCCARWLNAFRRTVLVLCRRERCNRRTP
jgi:hypothetical protein